MYLTGDHVKQNYSEARRWFSEAANQGDNGAQYHLGKIYKDGLGVNKDLSLAKNWFEKSAQAGNSLAKEELVQLN